MTETSVRPFTEIAQSMMSQSKFFMGYSRWLESESRYETWPEAVKRVMDMHRQKYAHVMTPELELEIQFAQNEYIKQGVLGAQRALQFGGPQIFQHESRLYNCASTHVDRPDFFQGAMYLLLSGCGVGFSVQKHHIAQLPDILPRGSESLVFQVPDSIEGWAQSFGVLLSSYFADGGTFPEYQGKRVDFDYSLIRPRGAYISGGFKAPGPDGLREALYKCEQVMQKAVAKSNRFQSIDVYDFVMHMADAVLSGGVRRSATICLFSKDDEDMLKAKTGDWWVTNPQRGRSNNSVVLVRNELTRGEWAKIMTSVKEFGEPGFILTDSTEFAYNPCVEIGMLPKTADGRSGFQMCNLSEINGARCVDRDSFLRACRAGAILGTLQAGYTNFTFLEDATQEIVEREALIGVSITGWMNRPDVLFNEQNMIDGAELVKATNMRLAKMLGINPAARTTCVKPSGNASVLLGTASGIHGEHAPQYFRHVQMKDNETVCELLQEVNPIMVEQMLGGKPIDRTVAFPVKPPEGSIYKSDLLGVKQLDYVKKAQQYWVEYGTNQEFCTDIRLRHNVSNTITVDDWDEVEQYIFDNRDYFAGISLLSAFGDKAYVQAPFMEVPTMDTITATYGDAALLASGLIVDGLYAFDDNLWLACDTANGWGLKLHTSHRQDLMKRDWVRRAQNFASNYFDGDMMKMTNCLKDVFNFHKWKTIERQIIDIDFALELGEQEYTDVSTMGAQACSGGACEVSW